MKSMEPPHHQSHTISILSDRLQLCTLPRESLPYISHFLISNIFFSGEGIPSRRDLNSVELKCQGVTESSPRPQPAPNTETIPLTLSDTSILSSTPSREFISISINDFEVSIIMSTRAVSQLPSNSTCPGLDICPDTFRALQIDDDGITPPGERITQLAKPLAFEGISIFYLSTYQTDLVFVKEKRVPLVITTLCKEGFIFLDLDQWDHAPTPPTMSAVPPSNVHESSISYLAIGMKSRDTSETVPSRRDVSTNVGSIAIPESALIPNETSLITPQSAHSCTCHAPPDVEHLPKVLLEGIQLQLVGLNQELKDEWAMILMKVLFFSNQPIQSHENGMQTDAKKSSSQFISFTVTEEGVSMVADSFVLEQFPGHILHSSLNPVSLKCIQVDVTTLGLDRYGIVYSMAYPLVSANVNLLYLSTLRTANVLVKEEDLPLALELLKMTR